MPLHNASRILFVNGGLDPVRSFSPRATLSPRSDADLEVVNVVGMAHTYDTFPAFSGDSGEVTAARATILSAVSRWVVP